MPELIEVERYRQAALATVGRRIESVTVVDELMVVGMSGAMLADAVADSEVIAARRRGKLLMLDLEGPQVLGLHFGMTGRLVVADDDPVERLEYGARTDDA